MAEPSLQLGNGNWAGKSGNLLGYHKVVGNFYADELTFTRASTGTIVNADGLIEEVPYNQFTYSEQFDNAGWTKVRGSITANSTTAPNGTTTADTFTCSETSTNGCFARQTTTLTNERTASIYVKPNTCTFFQIHRDYGDGVVFNLNNGTIKQSVNASGVITDVGGGWYRCSATFQNSGLSLFIFGNLNMTVTSWSSTINENCFIWGAQLNSGSTAKPYYPTTTRLNVPRVDYLNNANGSLILEPQRTNLNTYSEDIPQNYVITEISDTFEYSTSPNGLQTSTRLQLSNVGSSRYVQTLTGIVSNGTTYNFSCYYKGTLGETAYMYALPVGGTAITKAITFTGEWQRENLTFTAGASSNYVYIVDSRQGGDASDFEVWGAQVEAGSYATSYIPTSGTTVTRLADTSATTGLSDVINSTEGVLYAEIAGENDGTFNYISLSDGGITNYAGILYTDTDNEITFRYYGAGTQIQIIVSVSDLTAFNKVAIKWKVNDFALWINGVEVGSATSGAVHSSGVFDTLAFARGGSNNTPFYGNCQNLQIFKTALTDTELATLTT